MISLSLYIYTYIYIYIYIYTHTHQIPGSPYTSRGRDFGRTVGASGCQSAPC